MAASIAQRPPSGRGVRIKERSRTGGEMPPHDVIIYTARGLSVYHAEVEFLSQNNVAYFRYEVFSETGFPVRYILGSWRVLSQ
jgi:hypothetical protein